MSIKIPGKLSSHKSPIRLKDGNLGENDEPFVAWWYSGIKKNIKSGTQPNVLVAFRKISKEGLSDDVVFRNVPLTTLGQVRIGTVWKNNCCVAKTKFDCHDFEVDFTKGKWRLSSFYTAHQESLATPFPAKDIYPLLYEHDKNWVLEFPIRTGGKLVIPALEFFARCYGRSGELKRVLTTYDWETARDKLYAPSEIPETENRWHVKLRRRLVNGDVVLLAHAKYDRYTRQCLKKIYSQIESQYAPPHFSLTNTSKKSPPPIFIKVAPWFQGPANVRVEGIWFDGGRSFLGLNISGCSDPQGVLVTRGRENTNKTLAPAENGGAGTAWEGTPDRLLIKPPEFIDLNSDDDPDHGGPAVEIQDEDFVTLGVPRAVIDIKRDQAKNSAGNKIEGSEASSYSTGEPYGDGKGVGYASIHARPVMETHGALRDVWNALLRAGETHPEVIRSIEWFTFEQGFQRAKEPCLVGLEAFPDNLQEDISGTTRNWPYLDLNTKSMRGLLISRVLTNTKTVYLAEIQRRSRHRKDGTGNMVEKEESFQGLVFQLDVEQAFEPWIKQFMSQVRYVRGIVKKLEGECPGAAKAYPHHPSDSEEVPCEAAVRNALWKVGVLI